jgi:hypothetical protein
VNVAILMMVAIMATLRFSKNQKKIGMSIKKSLALARYPKL